MYEIILEEPAKRFIKKLNRREQLRVIDKLEQLRKNPKLGKPLVGELTGFWSLRIGDYRAVYQIRHNELLILVLKAGHRKNIYDKF